MKLLIFLVFIISFIIPSTKLEASNPSSYIVYDINSKSVIRGSNINTKSLIASTTKILTALVAIEYYDIFMEVTVDKEDTLIEGSKVYIKENEHFTLLDMLYGLMLRSGNDCANLIANEDPNGYDHFIFLMNQKCRELKMKDSYFLNPSGLDSKDENISTAYDMALLMSAAVKNEYFLEIASAHSYKTSSKEGSFYSWSNKNKLVLSDERFIAGKTGYTKSSGRTLVNYAKGYSREVVIVTINDSNDWSNHRAYLEDLQKYVDYDLIRKGIYQINGYDYKIKISKDIRIPLIKSEINKYKYVLHIGSKLYLYVYLDDLYINKYEIENEE